MVHTLLVLFLAGRAAAVEVAEAPRTVPQVQGFAGHPPELIIPEVNSFVLDLKNAGEDLWHTVDGRAGFAARPLSSPQNAASALVLGVLLDEPRALEAVARLGMPPDEAARLVATVREVRARALTESASGRALATHDEKQISKALGEPTAQNSARIASLDELERYAREIHKADAERAFERGRDALLKSDDAAFGTALRLQLPAVAARFGPAAAGRVAGEALEARLLPRGAGPGPELAAAVDRHVQAVNAFGQRFHITPTEWSGKEAWHREAFGAVVDRVAARPAPGDDAAFWEAAAADQQLSWTPAAVAHRAHAAPLKAVTAAVLRAPALAFEPRLGPYLLDGTGFLLKRLVALGKAREQVKSIYELRRVADELESDLGAAFIALRQHLAARGGELSTPFLISASDQAAAAARAGAARENANQLRGAVGAELKRRGVAVAAPAPDFKPGLALGIGGAALLSAGVAFFLPLAVVGAGLLGVGAHKLRAASKSEAARAALPPGEPVPEHSDEDLAEAQREVETLLLSK